MIRKNIIRHLQICPRKIKLGNSIYKTKCQPKNPTVQVSKSIYNHTVKPLPTNGSHNLHHLSIKHPPIFGVTTKLNIDYILNIYDNITK